MIYWRLPMQEPQGSEWRALAGRGCLLDWAQDRHNQLWEAKDFRVKTSKGWDDPCFNPDGLSE
jgi:hypothetical protein